MEEVTINNITMVKVKGKVKTINIPDSAWNKPDETGKKYIALEKYYSDNEKEYMKLYEDYTIDEKNAFVDSEYGLSKWMYFVE